MSKSGTPPTTREKKTTPNRRRWAGIICFLLVVWLVCLLPIAALLHWAFGLEWFTLLIPASLLLTTVYAFGSLRLLRSGPDWLAFLSMQYLGVCSVGWLPILTGLILEAVTPDFDPLFLVSTVWIILAAIGLYQAQRITQSFHQVADNRILTPARVVQLSDVHIGSRRAGFLERVVTQTIKLNPDITVITGDLVDLTRVGADDLQSLARLQCPVLMCTGNHERYIDLNKALAAVKSHRVIVLRDKMVTYAGISFIGIDDRENTAELENTLQNILDKTPGTNKTKATSAESVPGGSEATTPDSPYTIVLYHKPDGWQYVKQYSLPLMLAGHTHKGQVWPFNLIVKHRYPEIVGWYTDIASALYVSSGTGTWGPVMRLGSRNEISVFDFVTGEAVNQITKHPIAQDSSHAR